MSKKKRKDKEVAKLRSEVEVLRAQLNVSGSQGVKVSKQERAKPATEIQTEAKTIAINVLPNLKKTAVLTAVCLGILVVLFLTQSRWLP